MTDEMKSFMFEYIKNNLRLDLTTDIEYQGGMNGDGNMYKESHTVELILDGEVISSVYFG